MRPDSFTSFAPHSPNGRGHAADRSTATAAVRQHSIPSRASLSRVLAADVVRKLRWQPLSLFSMALVIVKNFARKAFVNASQSS